MKETKTVTLRLPVEMTEELSKIGDGSINQGVKNVYDELKRHERYADLEIKGVLTEKEWMFLAESLNGTMVLDDFRFAKDSLIAHNQDSETYNCTATKWQIDLEELNAKILSLTASQVEAIYRRVEKYWNTPDTNINVWAKY